MSEELQQLIRSYEKSKVRRVAAVYNDTPPHLRHQVHKMFGMPRALPVQYLRYHLITTR